MKRNLFYVLTAALLLSACGEKPVTLRMNLQPGQEYEIATVAEQTASMTIYNQEITYTQLIDLNHVFHVDSVLPDSQYLFNGYLKSVRMEVLPKSNKGLVQGFVYNSENASENKGSYVSFSYIFSKFLKKPYAVRVNNLGDVLMNTKTEVIRSIGIDTVAESKDALEDDFTTLFAVIPKKPVRVGDTYERNYTSGTDNHMEWQNNYTVKEINDNEVIVDFKGTIKSKENHAGQATFTGEHSGTMHIARETGLVNSSATSMSIQVKDDGGINAAPKISGKVTYNCKKIK